MTSRLQSRIVRYPDTGDGGDVSDWLAQGHTLEDLLERIEEARATGPIEPGSIRSPT